MPSDLTVLVKKSDGTTERVSLAELAHRKGAVKPSVSDTAVHTPATPTAVQSATPPVTARPAPPRVNKPVPAPPQAPSLPKEDFAAPLSEALPFPAKTGVPTSDTRSTTVDTIIKKLSFTVPAEHVNRLRSLIQLRLKDIRSAVESKELAQKSFAAGGLGLSVAASTELVSLSGNDDEAPVSKLPKALRQNNSSPVVDPTLPSIILPAGLPATSTPFNAFVHRVPKDNKAPTSTNPQHLDRPSKPPVHTPPVTTPRPITPPPTPKFTLNTAVNKLKPSAHDISAPSVAMSPVEELAALTITDFRRLATDPKGAAVQLTQKFTNLKDESIILYFQALDAWRRSPLYQDYTGALIRSLATNESLPTLLRDKKNLQLSELTALVDLEKQLH